MTATTIYHGGVVFTADPSAEQSAPLAEAFAVRDGRFISVGSLSDVRSAVDEGGLGSSDVTEVDLDGQFVDPGIIDSHTHLVGFGDSLARVQLRDCTSLAEIQERLAAARAADPAAVRVLGSGWLFDAMADGRPTAAMLDAVLPDVPVYLDANDFHSVWVNSAALQELGIDASTPNPVGGEVVREANGAATGLLLETAGTQYAWAFLSAQSTEEDVIAALDRAFAAYLEAGVTGATEMSLNGSEVAGLRAIVARDGRLPFPVSAHWILEPTGDTERDLTGVAAITALRDEVAAGPESDWLRIAGAKFIMDGTIDACTATMIAPYANGTNAEPIWSAERIMRIAEAADRDGLQIAMHAIGDRTSQIALDVVDYCVRANGPRERRHRIEHLESVSDDTIVRMGELGVVASMQPVHCDPAVLDNWKAQLGDGRQELGFPWQKFRAAGVAMTLGTDAPTAPHEALPNLYIALTGASVLAPERDPYHPERAFTPAEALTALTAGGAFAGGMDGATGRIRQGLSADFIVFDVNPLEAAPTALLDSRVQRTFVRGEERYRAE